MNGLNNEGGMEGRFRGAFSLTVDQVKRERDEPGAISPPLADSKIGTLQ